MKTLLLAGLIAAGTANAASPFVRDQMAATDGTYQVGEIEIAPAFLVERFGRPGKGDGLRVSGLYAFKSTTGKVFTVYDYKATTVWAEDEELPTPKVFWEDRSAQTLSIGSRGDDPAEFKHWLLSEYRSWRGSLASHASEAPACSSTAIEWARTPLETFRELEPGSTRARVTQTVGTPSCLSGFGIGYDVYLLPDGRRVWIAYPDGTARWAYVADGSGQREWLFGRPRDKQ
jgi:hypothetical protein